MAAVWSSTQCWPHATAKTETQSVAPACPPPSPPPQTWNAVCTRNLCAMQSVPVEHRRDLLGSGDVHAHVLGARSVSCDEGQVDVCLCG